MSHSKKTFFINNLIEDFSDIKKEKGNIPLFWQDKDGLFQPYLSNSVRIGFFLTEVRKSIIGQILVINHEMFHDWNLGWVPTTIGSELKNTSRSQFSDKMKSVIIINGGVMDTNWEDLIQTKSSLKLSETIAMVETVSEIDSMSVVTTDPVVTTGPVVEKEPTRFSSKIEIPSLKSALQRRAERQL